MKTTRRDFLKTGIGGLSAIVSGILLDGCSKRIGQSSNNDSESKGGAISKSSVSKSLQSRFLIGDYAHYLARGSPLIYQIIAENNSLWEHVSSMSMYEGDERIGSFFNIPDGRVIFGYSDIIESLGQEEIVLEELIRQRSIIPVVFTENGNVIFIGNRAYIRGKPKISDEEGMSDEYMIDENPRISDVFNGEWIREDMDLRDCFFPETIEYNYGSINRNSILLYDKISSFHEPMRVKGIVGKDGTTEGYALIFYDGLIYDDKGMKLGNSSFENPPTMILSYTYNELVLSNQFGSRRFKKSMQE
ncbi:MAG: hypothetical protein WC548_04310 [Candidatus Pacearchaeota archaeon]